MKRIEFDGMPPEVALQNLLEPTQNLSSSFKRTCARARYKHWIGEQTAKPEQLRLGSRMKRTSIDRLLRQIQRSERRLKILTKILEAIPEGLTQMREQFVQRNIMPLVHRGLAAQAELKRREKHINIFQDWKKSIEAQLLNKPFVLSEDEIKKAKEFIDAN